MEIYKNIAIYNIWNGTIYFTNSHQDEKIYYAADDYKNLKIYASVDKRLSAKVLEFWPNVCEGIGALNLYQTREDKTLQKKLANNLKKNIKHFDGKNVNYSLYKL